MNNRFANTRGFLTLIFVTCLATQALEAYQYPLPLEAIHEAYVLGRRNDRATANFFAPYITPCTVPEVSCFVTQIQILTPFAQVVDLTRGNTSRSYTEQQALKDYQQRGDTFDVQIKLVLPAAYKTNESNRNQNSPDLSVSLRPENFWRNFRFDLKQHGRVVAPRSIHSNPIYSMPANAKSSVLDGAKVLLVYNAKDVASEEVTIEVRTPESKTITVVFDLKTLR
ncbi:MAG TPA: hypothetical protein VN749_17385 [Candidatus Eisenbacteria bacterium]|nr:hypothetical protein [Candidatus Eisenbacteria bacterium]